MTTRDLIAITRDSRQPTPAGSNWRCMLRVTWRVVRRIRDGEAMQLGYVDLGGES